LSSGMEGGRNIPELAEKSPHDEQL